MCARYHAHAIACTYQQIDMFSCAQFLSLPPFLRSALFPPFSPLFFRLSFPLFALFACAEFWFHDKLRKFFEDSLGDKYQPHYLQRSGRKKGESREKVEGGTGREEGEITVRPETQMSSFPCTSPLLSFVLLFSSPFLPSLLP